MHILENDGIHLHRIVESTECQNHSATQGQPCWSLYIAAEDRAGFSVCGRRIKRAGYNGRIDPKSLRSKQKPSHEPRSGFRKR